MNGRLHLADAHQNSPASLYDMYNPKFVSVNFGSLFGPRPQNNNNNNQNPQNRINLGDLANGFFQRFPKPKVIFMNFHCILYTRNCIVYSVDLYFLSF